MKPWRTMNRRHQRMHGKRKPRYICKRFFETSLRTRKMPSLEEFFRMLAPELHAQLHEHQISFLKQLEQRAKRDHGTLFTKHAVPRPGQSTSPSDSAKRNDLRMGVRPSVVYTDEFDL